MWVDRRIRLGAAGAVIIPESRYGISDGGLSFGAGDFHVDVDRVDIKFLLE